MDANYATCLPIILKAEGGYTVDQGGPTMLGVTQKALSSWLRRPASVEEVKALTPEAVAPLYKADYWNAAHCNELPVGVDLMTFDESVNEGAGRAIRHVQAALGVTPDGMFGPNTRLAVGHADHGAVIRAMHAVNAQYYESLAAKYPEDERGWHARNDHMMVMALGMLAA